MGFSRAFVYGKDFKHSSDIKIISTDSAPFSRSLKKKAENTGEATLGIPNDMPDGQYFFRVEDTGDPDVFSELEVFLVQNAITIIGTIHDTLFDVDTYILEWAYGDKLAKINILLISADTDAFSLMLSENIVNSGRNSLRFPSGTPRGNYFIRLQAAEDTAVFADTEPFYLDSLFYITYRSCGDTLHYGDTCALKWEYASITNYEMNIYAVSTDGDSQFYTVGSGAVKGGGTTVYIPGDIPEGEYFFHLKERRRHSSSGYFTNSAPFAIIPVPNHLDAACAYDTMYYGQSCRLDWYFGDTLSNVDISVISTASAPLSFLVMEDVENDGIESVYLTRKIPKGEYFFRVRDVDDDAAYADSKPFRMDITFLTLFIHEERMSRPGEIKRSREEKIYKFEAVAGRTYHFSSTSGFALDGLIADSCLDILASDKTGRNIDLAWTPGYTGAYYFIVVGIYGAGIVLYDYRISYNYTEE